MEFPNIKSHPERVCNLRKFEGNYNWSGLEFPVLIRDIGIFERNNEISVNVLAIEDRNVYICRKGTGAYDQKIDLMLVMDRNRKHYMAVKSLSRLLTRSNTKHKCKHYFCTNCLQGFTQELSRD